MGRMLAEKQAVKDTLGEIDKTISAYLKSKDSGSQKVSEAEFGELLEKLHQQLLAEAISRAGKVVQDAKRIQAGEEFQVSRWIDNLVNKYSPSICADLLNLIGCIFLGRSEQLLIPSFDCERLTRQLAREGSFYRTYLSGEVSWVQSGTAILTQAMVSKLPSTDADKVTEPPASLTVGTVIRPTLSEIFTVANLVTIGAG